MNSVKMLIAALLVPMLVLAALAVATAVVARQLRTEQVSDTRPGPTLTQR
jgi:type IV secretory pathway VirB6-like protein